MSKSGRPDEVGLTDVLAQTVGLHPPLQRYEIPAFDDPPLLPLVEANPETVRQGRRHISCGRTFVTELGMFN